MFSSPKSPALPPMSPTIMEDLLSDSNSILTSDESLSPTLQPQRKYSALYKAKPTTQLSLGVSSSTAYSSSSADSSVKSFNAISNKIDDNINGETRLKEGSVDDLLIGLMNRSNSVASNDKYLSAFRSGKGFINSPKRTIYSEPENIGSECEVAGSIGMYVLIHFIFKKKFIIQQSLLSTFFLT
jgi:hypothetical protein